MLNWRSTLAHYLKYTSQYDCQKISYPYNSKEYVDKPYTEEKPCSDDEGHMESSESSSDEDIESFDDS